MMDLSLIWVGIIGLGVWIYVILDGFDLGIGILFPVVTDKQQRDVMMNAVAPVWDGNETWMVLGTLTALPLLSVLVIVSGKALMDCIATLSSTPRFAAYCLSIKSCSLWACQSLSF